MIWVNGTKLKTPPICNLERYNLTKSGRVASGKMTMELIAKKRKLLLEYDIISGKDMQTILKLIDSDAMFFKVDYDLPEGKGTMTCYVGAIPASYFRRSSGWYWRDVNFSLIEQ